MYKLILKTMNRIITKFVVASQKSHEEFENRICDIIAAGVSDFSQHHSSSVKVTLVEVLNLVSLAVDYIDNKDYKAFHRGIREVVCSNPDLITQDEKIFVDQFISHIQALLLPVR